MTDDKQEPDDEFERFADLTKRLLAVSKTDLDRQRKADRDTPPQGVGESAVLD